MPEPSTLLVFVAAALALLVVPGPAVLYIVARSVDQGRTAGLVSVLGIAAGTLCHIAAASLGISALLVSSSLAFAVLKYAGAAYLIYLGIRNFLARPKAQSVEAPPRQSYREVFLQGALVNILNPKTALFFFAFLPQFVDPARGEVGPQVLFLGLLMLLLAVLSDGAYALLAGSLSGWLRGNLRFLNAQRYFAGGVYMALGVAAVADSGRSE